jgi:short-subunit dehydrogenase
VTRLRGASLLVTGGARGLGFSFARAVAERSGARVTLWDVDAQRLAVAVDELRSAGHDAHGQVVDVSMPEPIERAAGELLADGGAPDVLCNNAGVVTGKAFARHSTDEIERTVRINVLGVMHVTRALLPAMLRRGSGHVVNIASAAGYLPNPGMSVYVASKWAVLGWSESLRIELERARSGIRVTTVTPSYVDTGMFEGVRAPLLTPVLAPERLVRDMLRAVERDRILLRAPFMVRLLPPLRGLLPARAFDLIVGRLFRVYSSMEGFVGRAHNP